MSRALHQKAHNELEELGEPVSETKKVSEFLKYISDPTLQMGLQIVMGGPGQVGQLRVVSTIPVHPAHEYRTAATKQAQHLRGLRRVARIYEEA
jgi:hypothetical protein